MHGHMLYVTAMDGADGCRHSHDGTRGVVGEDLRQKRSGDIHSHKTRALRANLTSCEHRDAKTLALVKWG